MSIYFNASRIRTCDCGSGKPSMWINDAQGIPLVRACSACEKAKLSVYRPEILTGYNQNDVDEPIEPEPDCIPEGDIDHDDEDRQAYWAERNERHRPSEY